MNPVPLSPQEIASRIQAGEETIRTIEKDLEILRQVIDDLDTLSRALDSALAEYESKPPEALSIALSNAVILLSNIARRQHVNAANMLMAEMAKVTEAVRRLKALILYMPRDGNSSRQ